jgi:CRP-like cAMP-binding protein
MQQCDLCNTVNDTFFVELSEKEQQFLNSIKTCKVYKKGAHIFEEGTFPKGLYSVCSGKIKVSQMGFDGKEQIVHLIRNGQIMGHRALFSQDCFSCSGIALEDSKVCFIPKNDFFDLVERNPSIAFKILNLLASELKEAEAKITQLAQQPVKQRIAKTIIQLKKQYGTNVNNSIDFAVKREDFANLAGTTRETATRVLYELQEQKIILLTGKTIQILDEKKLQQFLYI